MRIPKDACLYIQSSDNILVGIGGKESFIERMDMVPLALKVVQREREKLRLAKEAEDEESELDTEAGGDSQSRAKKRDQGGDETWEWNTLTTHFKDKWASHADWKRCRIVHNWLKELHIPEDQCKGSCFISLTFANGTNPTVYDEFKKYCQLKCDFSKMENKQVYIVVHAILKALGSDPRHLKALRQTLKFAVITNDGIEHLFLGNKDLAKIQQLVAPMANSAVDRKAKKADEQNSLTPMVRAQDVAEVFKVEKVEPVEPGTAPAEAGTAAGAEPAAKKQKTDDSEGGAAANATAAPAAKPKTKAQAKAQKTKQKVTKKTTPSKNADDIVGGDCVGTDFAIDLTQIFEVMLKNTPTTSIDDYKQDEIDRVFRVGVRFGMKDPQEVLTARLNGDGKGIKDTKLKKYLDLRCKLKTHLVHQCCSSTETDDPEVLNGPSGEDENLDDALLPQVEAVNVYFANNARAKKKREALRGHMEENPASASLHEIKATHVAFIKMVTAVRRNLKEHSPKSSQSIFHGESAVHADVMRGVLKIVDLHAPQEQDSIYKIVANNSPLFLRFC
jgi:hypothetical protein